MSRESCTEEYRNKSRESCTEAYRIKSGETTKYKIGKWRTKRISRSQYI